jgi:5'(3')-deoxyribonucleotidase
LTRKLNTRGVIDVGVDVDQVVANFRDHYCHLATVTLGRPVQVLFPHWDVGTALGLTADEKRVVDRLMKSPGVCRQLQPLEGALEGVRTLAGIARRVFFVTAPWVGSVTWAGERSDWLAEHFGRLGGNVISTRHKYIFPGSVLIDDKPMHLDEWLMEPYPRRKLAVCWSHDYNEGWSPDVTTGRHRTNDWEELHELVRRMA